MIDMNQHAAAHRRAAEGNERARCSFPLANAGRQAQGSVTDE
jgi:hypothetical protein